MSVRDGVLDWLLESDPAIRWQTLRDLDGAPAEVVTAERARVATEGWGAQLLALQGEDGQWAGGALFPARRLDPEDGDRSARPPGEPWVATERLDRRTSDSSTATAASARRTSSRSCGCCMTVRTSRSGRGSGARRCRSTSAAAMR